MSVAYRGPQQIVPLGKRALAVRLISSYQSLHGRRLGDVPHFHPGALLLLPTGAVGAPRGPAVERHHQAGGGEYEHQEQEHRQQAHGQQEGGGQTVGRQLERKRERRTCSKDRSGGRR